MGLIIWRLSSFLHIQNFPEINHSENKIRRLSLHRIRVILVASLCARAWIFTDVRSLCSRDNTTNADYHVAEQLNRSNIPPTYRVLPSRVHAYVTSNRMVTRGRIANCDLRVGSPRVGGAQRHACKFAYRPACNSTPSCPGMRGAVAAKGSGGGAEVATNCIHYSCSRALLPRSSAPASRGAARGARARSSLRQRRPTIVYEMIMVARYEVAGSREAVRHLDWPVGSYKRREAREDDAIMRHEARRCRKLGRVLFRGTLSRDGCRRETVWIYDRARVFTLLFTEAGLDRAGVCRPQQWKTPCAIFNAARWSELDDKFRLLSLYCAVRMCQWNIALPVSHPAFRITYARAASKIFLSSASQCLNNLR